MRCARKYLVRAFLLFFSYQRKPLPSPPKVCKKDSNIYQAGTIGFCISGGVPKVGVLVRAADNTQEACSFKILPLSSLSVKDR